LSGVALEPYTFSFFQPHVVRLDVYAAENEFYYAKICTTDFDSKAELLVAFAKAFEFPDWWGRNWDALQDCMRDLSWLEKPGYVLGIRLPDDAGTDLGIVRTTAEILLEALYTMSAQKVPLYGVLVSGNGQSASQLSFNNVLNGN
jgi:RNAse (barnase) inhibitor barstar